MSSDPSLIEVKSQAFERTIIVPSSKSYANRLLILAALDKKDVLIKNLPLSSDVTTMIQCLKEIGLDLKEENGGLRVSGTFPECESKPSYHLKTGDGGTTNRFIVPFLALGSSHYEVEPTGHMRERPMGPLISYLKEFGATVDETQKAWLSFKGPVSPPSEVTISATKSTQFVTGVALSLAKTKTKVTPGDLSISQPYWRLTENLIQKFKREELDYVNPVDFSGLSYPLALAAVTGKVKVSNCVTRDPYQADSAFIGILEKMGAKISWDEEGLLCEKGSLAAIEVDGSQFPDVIPTLIFVCAFANGISTITNLKVLTHKECDRFQEMIKMCRTFGGEVEVDERNYSLKIKGQTFKKTAVRYIPPEDHRMVMVAYLFMRTLAGGQLGNHHHVKKSFANFFDVME